MVIKAQFISSKQHWTSLLALHLSTLASKMVVTGTWIKSIYLNWKNWSQTSYIMKVNLIGVTMKEQFCQKGFKIDSGFKLNKMVLLKRV